jgi:hypothetical protein
VQWFPLFALIGCMEYQQLAPNDADLPGETPLGDGPPDASTVPEGWGLDAWDLPSTATIDVIVYGDTSSSMTEELVTMGATVRPFIERLAETVPDWQLATVTGDTGCAVNGILRPETPDYEGLFAAAIVTAPSMPYGDIDEMGFQNTAMAVEASEPGGCNEGFVRGGLLHVIFISDENDESPGFDQDADYWRAYFDRIVAVHGDSVMITMSAVAGPSPDGCAGGGADAEPGEGYTGAVAATGGEFLSICSDWADDIDLLADAGTTRDTFALSDVPIPESLEVWLDGALVPAASRWTYDVAPNAVVFLVDPPHAGQRLDILYQVVETP